MASLTVVNENGETEEVAMAGRDVAIELEDGSLFQPAITQRVERDHEQGMSQITQENCGTTENRAESDPGADIIVEGVIGEEQVDTVKHLHDNRSLTFISEVYTGPVVVKRATIEQNTDIIHLSMDGNRQQLAFEFQLQLQQPEGGGVGAGERQGENVDETSLSRRTDYN